MKKPPLLPVLAFTAVLGAAVFLTISMPSCGSRDGAAERDAPAQQRRAFAAAVQGDPETLRAAAVAATKEKPDNRARLRPAKSAVEAGHLRACQREFLADPDRWQPGAAANATYVASMHHGLQEAWMRSLLKPPQESSSSSAVEMEGEARAHRRLVDELCADRTKLTPEAQKEWKQWEAKNWEGWMLAPLAVVLPPDTSDQTAKEHPAAQDSPEFLAGMQRHLHAVEYLSDERDRCAAVLEKMPKDGTPLPEYAAALASAEDQLTQARVLLETLAFVGKYADKDQRGEGKVLMVIDPDTAEE